MNARARVAAGVALSLLLAACGSARRSVPLYGPLELSASEARGEVVFMRHCHLCHPGGEAGLGPAINDKPLPAALIRFQVRRGLGAMPAFPAEELSREELDELTAFLAALRAR